MGGRDDQDAGKDYRRATAQSSKKVCLVRPMQIGPMAASERAEDGGEISRGRVVLQSIADRRHYSTSQRERHVGRIATLP